jgi:ribonuclease Y
VDVGPGEEKNGEEKGRGAMDSIVVILIALATAAVGGLVGYTWRKNYTEKKIERTEEYAKRL